MIRQSLFLAISVAVSTCFECNAHNACDNDIAVCFDGDKCVNPSGKPLGGCCVPEGMEVDEMSELAVADYVKENCGHAFACDNEVAQCWSHSQCINPSGEPLSGCCIPNNMDPSDIENGLPIKPDEESGEVKKTSEWEHLRGVIADNVIDNCGPAFACDSTYGCGDHSQCVNASEETLSGCCIPKGMDPNEIEKGLPIQSGNEDNADKGKISEWEYLRGVIADYVIDNCGPAFACDNNGNGCGDHSQCINPSGETLSGCCIPEGMNPDDIEKGLHMDSKSEAKAVMEKTSEWEHLRGVVADYVIDNCGPQFACDNMDYGCGDHSKCVNPTGEMLSGCCIPNDMDPESVENGLPKENTVDNLRGIIADYVIDNCGIGFACDSTYGCADHSKCVNPSGETLSGCCIPNTMDPNEIEKGLPLESYEYGTLNGIDLASLIAPYVKENCGTAFACDDIAAHCSEHSTCINPSEAPLAGCCVPKGMTREELETGKLSLKIEKDEEEEVDSICSASMGHCIPRVFMANETKFHEEL